MNQNLREIIKAKADEVKNIANLSPHRMAELVSELSAYLPNLADEITEAEWNYNQVVKDNLQKYEVAAKAQIESKASPAWKEWQLRLNYQKSVIQMIQSIKRFVRLSEEEMRNI